VYLPIFSSNGVNTCNSELPIKMLKHLMYNGGGGGSGSSSNSSSSNVICVQVLEW
jgi:hypothetical protein